MKTRTILVQDWQRLLEVTGQPSRKLKWHSYFSPRFASVFLVRHAHNLYTYKLYKLSKFVSLLNFLVFGAEVPGRLVIGPGLVLPHPQGIVLGANVIGENVTIFQHVTLGAKTLDFNYNPSERPAIQNNIVVAAGAKIIGGITIGSHSVIGANAVVTSDIPEHSLAVGVPAVVKRKN